MNNAAQRFKLLQDAIGPDLPIDRVAFISEYIKDLNQRRAAKACGHHGDKGNEFLGEATVQEALRNIFMRRLDMNIIDADWLISELVDNHYLARADGKINASNTALIAIGKLAAVDAFAAEKVQTVTSNDVIERLKRGRARAAAISDEVNFF